MLLHRGVDSELLAQTCALETRFLNRSTPISFLRLCALAAFVSSPSPAVLAEIIAPEQAFEHVGEQVTVEGMQVQVAVIESGTTFLNYGGRFPHQVFYGIIFGDTAPSFPDLSNLEGTVVSLTGTIELYRGKSQIILTSPSQIAQK